ncbi:Hypothetical predicted protein [Prunus dulcis]|uniref:Uncharacterized protein n=1 Tax=Prunus dulcis TaxID=3755 RepID=A0A5E4F088_PRUDU|nr:Hypothetical predicted protein [Prunus dulcis]
MVRQIIVSVLKACRGTRNQVGGGGIYNLQRKTFATLAGGGGGGDPPHPQPKLKPTTPSKKASKRDMLRMVHMRFVESLEELMRFDKIYVVTGNDTTNVQMIKRNHRWPGTHVIMHTDTNPAEMSKIKKAARECGLEPKTASKWEEEDEEEVSSLV